MIQLTEQVLFGGLTPPLLLFCGVFFLFYLRGLPFRCPHRMLRAVTHPTLGGVSPFRTVTLALAGTLGVGNIVGVANALTVGGPGAIFWMWISALAAMLLKYAEILLAVRHRRPNGNGWRGGAVYYIRDTLEQHRRPRSAAILSAIFAALTVLNAFSMGCFIQTNAVASAFEGVLGMAPALCGAMLLLCALPALRGGTKGISAVTEYLVPIMSAGYLILSVAVLLLQRERVLPALEQIVEEAFSLRCATGGVLGMLTSKAVQTGTMRGLLSNEGGCGTAPTAHAAANTDSPAAQGVWGILEVFVDTILLCTLTALVILVAPTPYVSFTGNAVMLTVNAYTSVLGDWAGIFFCAAIFCFGYATVICWAGYGAESINALGKGKRLPRLLYTAAYLLCIPLGCLAAPALIWKLSDFAIASLTALNLGVLLLARREIRGETLAFFVDKSKKS